MVCYHSIRSFNKIHQQSHLNCNRRPAHFRPEISKTAPSRRPSFDRFTRQVICQSADRKTSTLHGGYLQNFICKVIDRSNENADNSSQHFWQKKIKLCGPFPLNFCELASSEPSLKSCVALKVAVGIQWSGRPQIHRQVRHSGRSGRSDATATLWLEVSFTSKSNGRPCHYANEFETAFQLF